MEPTALRHTPTQYATSYGSQIKDEYWNPYYTAIVVFAFCMMPVCKFCGAMRLPPYNSEKVRAAVPQKRVIGRQ